MSLVAELRRRKVPQAVGLYLAVGFGAVEVLTYLVESLRPGWAGTSRYVLAAIYLIGLPVAVYVPWAYDYQNGHLRPVPTEREVSRAAFAGFVATLAMMEVALAGLILWQRDPQVGQPGQAVSGPTTAIAVLPFTDTSAAEENAEFLAMGLHDDLLTMLSRIDGLKVISRTSTVRYQKSDKSLSQIGAELGVDTILEGSVQRAGNRVRVNVQLIDASSDQHVWAERYDRDVSPDSLFEIQGDIAASIARAMRSTLSAQEQIDLAKVPTDSFEAYQAYLLGKHRMISRTSTGISAAAGYFREAIRLDPDFAAAYVGLADTFILMSEYGGLSRAEMTPKATRLLEQALALDERLAAAYTSMGAVRAKNADFSGAEAAFRHAIEIDHNNSTAFHWYADVLLLNKSQPETALPLLRRALELDPLSPAVIATFGQVLEALGRFEDAREQYVKIIEIEPASPAGYNLLGNFERFVNGRLDEAVRWYHESIARDPGNASVRANLGMCYLELGDPDRAAIWIDRAMARGPHLYWPAAASMLLGLWHHRRTESLSMADRLRDIWPQDNLSLLARVHFGDFEEAIGLYADRYPELSCAGDPQVSRENLFQAINLSLSREQTGERACAARLLVGALDVMSRMPRLGAFGYGVADAEAHARLGKKDVALETLRRAIGTGWRANWWLQAERSPHLATLRGNPEFEAIVNDLRADVAAQLAHVRDMERGGQLAAAP